MGTAFERLMDIDSARSKSTAIDAHTEKDISEAKALKEAENARQKRQARERAITADINKRMAEKKAAYGTTDPDKIRAVEDTGLSLKDVAALPKVARAIGAEPALEQLGAFERAAGAGASRQMDTGPDRPIMVGRGAADEPYFTNLTPQELHEERRSANAIREMAGLEAMKGGPRDLRVIDAGSTLLSGNSGDSRTPEEKKLDRSLDLVRNTIEGPGKRAEETANLRQKAEAHAKTFGLNAMSDMIDKTITGKKLGMVSATDAMGIRDDLMRRGATAEELAQDQTGQLLPWVEPKAGKMKDEKAVQTILNPGGAMTKEQMVTRRSEATIASLLSDVGGDTPKEAPTAYQLAQRRGQPAPKRKPQMVPYGGSGGKIDAANPIEYNAPFFPKRDPNASPWGFLEGSGTAIGQAVEGLSFAAGGKEHSAERKRRLAREKADREARNLFGVGE